MNQPLNIRRMQPDDLAFAVHLVDIEGWNVGYADLELLLTCEPEGCYIAEQGEQRIGMVTTTAYGPLGWIGSLIVEPEYRGRGIGAELMRQAIQYLIAKGATTIRLYAEQAAVPLYRRLGFVEECRRLYFRGRGARCTVQGVERMQPFQLSDVFRLDARCFGADRSRVLHRAWQGSPDLCFVSYVGGELIGYIMAKRAAAGAKIGPWICRPDHPDEARAEALLWAVLDALDGQPLGVGALENNRMSQEILNRNGFQGTPRGPRMRWGQVGYDGNSQGSLAIGAPPKG